jgi:hypothetical protein
VFGIFHFGQAHQPGRFAANHLAVGFGETLVLLNTSLGPWEPLARFQNALRRSENTRQASR